MGNKNGSKTFEVGYYFKVFGLAVDDETGEPAYAYMKMIVADADTKEKADKGNERFFDMLQTDEGKQKLCNALAIAGFNVVPEDLIPITQKQYDDETDEDE